MRASQGINNGEHNKLSDFSTSWHTNYPNSAPNKIANFPTSNKILQLDCAEIAPHLCQVITKILPSG
jgi:hypothetical protein